MTKFGYTMMCEQSRPDQLVQDVQRAEKAGFDFSVISAPIRRPTHTPSDIQR